VVKLDPVKGISDGMMGVATQVELHDQLEHLANSPSIAGEDLTNVRRAYRGTLIFASKSDGRITAYFPVFFETPIVTR
jgi:hypothetical protein